MLGQWQFMCLCLRVNFGVRSDTPGNLIFKLPDKDRNSLNFVPIKFQDMNFMPATSSSFSKIHILKVGLRFSSLF